MKPPAGSDSRLRDFFELVGKALGSHQRKSAFATYVVGLFSALERKTAESIAAMTAPDPEKIDAEHQRLLHVIGQAKWNDRAVRTCVISYALKAILAKRSLDAWIIDDTGWIKKGRHSVGVQRQYTGTSGKVDNCQIGVSLAVSAGDVQLPLDFELYLPKVWIDDKDRRRKAKIPEEMQFRTKPELALCMVDRAIEDGVPKPKAVLGDAAYGNSSDFRMSLRDRGLHYALGVQGSTLVQRVDAAGVRRGPATSIERLAEKATYRKVTWRDGTKGKMVSRFAFYRVVPVCEKDAGYEDEILWLILEKPYDETEAHKYHISSLPRTISQRRLVRILHQRWRTERVYQDLKGELGLDHYEGRLFIGWHHHVSAVLVSYAFIAAEQSRLFPPHNTFGARNFAFESAT